MLSREKLVNILVFMERVPCTGKEAFGWAQTYEAVQGEIFALDAQPPVDNDHVAPGCELFGLKPLAEA
jgi:hypothetical protein